mgnify:FL=1
MSLIVIESEREKLPREACDSVGLITPSSRGLSGSSLPPRWLRASSSLWRRFARERAIGRECRSEDDESRLESAAFPPVDDDGLGPSTRLVRLRDDMADDGRSKLASLRVLKDEVERASSPTIEASSRSWRSYWPKPTLSSIAGEERGDDGSESSPSASSSAGSRSIVVELLFPSTVASTSSVEASEVEGVEAVVEVGGSTIWVAGESTSSKIRTVSATIPAGTTPRADRSASATRYLVSNAVCTWANLVRSHRSLSKRITSSSRLVPFSALITRCSTLTSRQAP